MSNVKVLYAVIALLGTSSVYAQPNLFAPKKEGITQEELNEIVEERLNNQKSSIEMKYDNELQTLKNSQQASLDAIMATLQELKADNDALKESQENIKKEAVKAAEAARRSNAAFEPSNSYSEAEVNEELKELFEEEHFEDDPAKNLVLDEDIERLNKEFGEVGLSFVGILGDQKIYKNGGGEYIIKPLDFEMPIQDVSTDPTDSSIPAQ